MLTATIPLTLERQRPVRPYIFFVGRARAVLYSTPAHIGQVTVSVRSTKTAYICGLSFIL